MGRLALGGGGVEAGNVELHLGEDGKDLSDTRLVLPYPRLVLPENLVALLLVGLHQTHRLDQPRNCSGEQLDSIG